MDGLAVPGDSVDIIRHVDTLGDSPFSERNNSRHGKDDAFSESGKKDSALTSSSVPPDGSDEAVSAKNDCSAAAPELVYPWPVPKYITVNYEKFFYIDANHDGNEDICILIHTNKLCILTLAPTHPVVKHRKEPSRVSYENCDGIDRSQSRAQGHRKKGAQFMECGSVVCRVDCVDGSTYSIASPIRGKLLEVNTRLLDCPNLLLSKPISLGYVAIIMPNAMEMDVIRKSLHSEQTYLQLRSPQEAS